MKELDSCLRDLVAAVRAAYQPTLAHDALVRAAIIELTQLEEPEPLKVTARGSESTLACVRVVPNAAPRPVPVSAATEQAIVEILRSENGETRISDAFDRRESELRTLFCSLSPLEAAALRKRLADPDDKLAEVFARFAPERRARLITVLGDARRREALQQARGRVAQRGAR
jgi:hypothetical protein